MSRNSHISVGLGDIIAIVASLLVGGGVAAATIVGVVTSSVDGYSGGRDNVAETGAGYVTDSEGIHYIPVEVAIDVETPQEWMCLPHERAKALVACYIPVGDDRVTEDEVDQRVKEAMARANASGVKVERQSVTVEPGDAEESNLVSRLTLFFTAFASVIAGAGLAWTIFTQREHLRALMLGVRRLLRRLSRRSSAHGPKSRHGTNVDRVSDVLKAAQDEAGRLIEPLGRRWQHLSAVGSKAEEVAEDLGLDVKLLAAACWLHDIGYAPQLVETGMHAIDGARHLRRKGWDERIVSMVAHHSCAELEAEERGLSADIAEFERPPGEYEDAVCFCDMTTGPDGANVPAPDRLDEIEVRYGPDHLVTRFIRRARPEILAAVARVEERRMSDAPLPESKTGRQAG